MKKKISLIILMLVVVLITGCFKRDQMEDISIITTIYPIEYVAKRLYGDSSKIISIYPSGINIHSCDEQDEKCELITEKQLRDFSEYDLFIYNGESSERDYATFMLNQNKKLKIIDAAYSLDATNIYSDVWLNPSNILMIAKNISNELETYISNPYMLDEINNKYKQLELDISELEAELKRTADNSTNKTIVSSDEALLFLEKYGFVVINITEDGNNIDKNINTAKDLFDSKKANYIFVHENEKENETIDSLISDYGLKKAEFRTIEIITEEDIKNNEDYLSIMYKNIDALKEETYK